MNRTEDGELLVDQTIAPEDEMFKGDNARYLSVGKSALWNIERAMASASPAPRVPEKILDFPCGHGRVMRYLRSAYPDAEITGCDLNRPGVDFCASRFGAIPVYSALEPSNIGLPNNYYDLIWVGSLFTHFDRSRWKTFLEYFQSVLEPGGLLVFSSQGRQAYNWMTAGQYTYGLDETRVRKIRRQYEATGFGYVNYHNEINYGITLAEPGWACRMITSLAELKLVSYGEKCWDDHHDIVACVRDSEWNVASTPAPNSLRYPGVVEKLIIPRARALKRRVFALKRSA